MDVEGIVKEAVMDAISSMFDEDDIAELIFQAVREEVRNVLEEVKMGIEQEIKRIFGPHRLS